MGYTYQPVTRAWASKFLPSYAANPLASRNAVGLATMFAVQSLEVQNRSGSVAHVGWGGRLPTDSTLWKAGQWTNGTTTFTDDTTDAQSAGANDFAAMVANTNNDGFIVLAQIPFNILSMIVGTAAAGGAPVYDVAYSAAGGAWTTITLANLLVAPAFATGEQLLWWQEPNDWVVTVAGHATGIPTGYYAIRVRATTAPTATAALLTQLIPGVMVKSIKNVASDGLANFSYGDAECLVPPQCDALAVAISVASDQNYVSAHYRLRG